MRHPFQRRTSKKSPVGTPFQKSLVDCLEGYTAGPKRMSGRQLSLLLGKSANHISQMLNDGLVPSGQTILEMADVLKLDQAETDVLIRAAMETKANQRSRDNFWINQTNRILKQADAELAQFREFVSRNGMADAWQQFKVTTAADFAPDLGEDLEPEADA